MVPQIIRNLLEVLGERQKAVILGRFGLEEGKEPQTLAAIGDKFDITRERVRQIENQSLGLLRIKLEKEKEALQLVARVADTLEKSAGAKSSLDLLATLQKSYPEIKSNHLIFLAAVSREFHYYVEDEDFHPFYYLDNKSLRVVEQLVGQLGKYLQAQRSAVIEGKGLELIKELTKKEKLNELAIEQALKISKKFHINPFGDLGLASWPEVRPQTIRDRIYLILHKHKKPLHFREIASLINEHGLSSKMALVPTVHNELIKDKRFVLVGRGMYALGEQGYKPGTARDVIGRILKEEGSLTPEQIVLAVEKERFFKPNTVVANLQNKKHFERLPNGRYQVRES